LLGAAACTGGLERARAEANETSAIASLRAIVSAQLTFQAGALAASARRRSRRWASVGRRAQWLSRTGSGDGSFCQTRLHRSRSFRVQCRQRRRPRAMDWPLDSPSATTSSAPRVGGRRFVFRGDKRRSSTGARSRCPTFGTPPRRCCCRAVDGSLLMTRPNRLIETLVSCRIQSAASTRRRTGRRP
jgi:hypothetical protein